MTAEFYSSGQEFSTPRFCHSERALAAEECADLAQEADSSWLRSGNDKWVSGVILSVARRVARGSPGGVEEPLVPLNADRPGEEFSLPRTKLFRESLAKPELLSAREGSLDFAG
jgi:hypothetical protein